VFKHIYKLIAIVGPLVLIVFYQNCGNIESGSISSLSEGISGTASIDGYLEFYDSADTDSYLAQAQTSSYGNQIIMSKSDIDQANGGQFNQNPDTYVLCMIKSEANSLEYNPVGFFDTGSTSNSILVPICMPATACLSHLTELDDEPLAHVSIVCSDTSASVRFDSDQVLQLVKRY